MGKIDSLANDIWKKSEMQKQKMFSIIVQYNIEEEYRGRISRLKVCEILRIF